ncbi:MAG: L,D-transpeptidase family protein [Verrucomicrobiaceae bacterium]|nr:L,D-transpeptidase family protein [Verrucomicrobiaceae bacterium]
MTGVLYLLTSSELPAQIGPAVRQIIISQSESWSSQTATMQCFERTGPNAPWQRAFSAAMPVLLGRNGLAWGRGVFQVPANGIPMKVEKDGKAPAGVFQLGQLFGYAESPPPGTTWPYLQVGPYDAWVDDVNSPYYNKHVRVKPNQVPQWFEKQRMRLGDSAYKWMLAIGHNSSPPAAGYGSAIFFHVRRGPRTPTAGCTSMAEENLVKLIKWLDPKASPHYVLLPVGEYQALRANWRLP